MSKSRPDSLSVLSTSSAGFTTEAKSKSDMADGLTYFVLICSISLIISSILAVILFPQNMKHDWIGIVCVIATHLVLIVISLKVVWQIKNRTESKKWCKLIEFFNLFGLDKLHLISIFFIAYDFICAVLLMCNIAKYNKIYYILYVFERLLSCIALTLPCFLLQMYCESIDGEKNKSFVDNAANGAVDRSNAASVVSKKLAGKGVVYQNKFLLFSIAIAYFTYMIIYIILPAVDDDEYITRLRLTYGVNPNSTTDDIYAPKYKIIYTINYLILKSFKGMVITHVFFSFLIATYSNSYFTGGLHKLWDILLVKYSIHYPFNGINDKNVMKRYNYNTKQKRKWKASSKRKCLKCRVIGANIFIGLIFFAAIVIEIFRFYIYCHCLDISRDTTFNIAINVFWISIHGICILPFFCFIAKLNKLILTADRDENIRNFNIFGSLAQCLMLSFIFVYIIIAIFVTRKYRKHDYFEWDLYRLISIMVFCVFELILASLLRYLRKKVDTKVYTDSFRRRYFLYQWCVIKFTTFLNLIDFIYIIIFNSKFWNSYSSSVFGIRLAQSLSFAIGALILALLSNIVQLYKDIQSDFEASQQNKHVNHRKSTNVSGSAGQEPLINDNLNQSYSSMNNNQ